MTSRFKKAVKKKSKLRMGIYGPAGSGKTLTALRVMKGLVGDGTIAVVDSEHGSASKYADRYDFVVDELGKGEKRVANYLASLTDAAAEGVDGIIIDSLSHAWQELLEEVDRLGATKFKGNKWSAWSEATPKQKQLIESILSFPGHVICTMRSKTEWVQETGANGKTKPVRVGLQPEQGKGIEYEFDLLMEINISHVAEVTKDRTGYLQDKWIEKPGEEMGEWLRAWCDGEVPAKEMVHNQGVTTGDASDGDDEDAQHSGADAADEPADEPPPPDDDGGDDEPGPGDDVGDESAHEHGNPEPGDDEPEPPKKKRKSMAALAVDFLKAADACSSVDEVDEMAAAWQPKFDGGKLEPHAKAYTAYKRALIQAFADEVDMEEWDPVDAEVITADEFELVEQLAGLSPTAA